MNTLQLLIDLGFGLGGWILIQGAYLGFKLQLPNSYASLSETHSLRVHDRLWRMTLFRSGPVFVLSILTWTLSFRAGGTGWLAVAIAAALHIIVSNGMGFVKSVKNDEVNYGSYHLLASALVGIGAVSASLLGPSLKGLVPSIDTLLEAVWTAVFVAILGSIFIKLTKLDNQSDSSSVDYLTSRALRDTGIALYDYLFTTASKNQCDPLLAKTVMTCEVLQRPKWMRRSERILGRVVGKGTYGVMQQEFTQPISDQYSIDLFTKKFAEKQTIFVNESGFVEVNYDLLWAYASEQNGGDPSFIQSVEKVYESLFMDVEWIHEQEHSASGAIGIVERRRYGKEWGIRVITNAEHLSIYEESTVEYKKLTENYRSQLSSHGSWRSFEYRCPMGTKYLYIRNAATGSPDEPLTLSTSNVDLSVDN